MTSTTGLITSSLSGTSCLSSSNTSAKSNQQCLSVRDILAHKSTMFNYKLPSDRTMYESSLIYCNLCDFSCDLTDKSAIICHYLAKHPDDNIVYSYLWPQMEQNPVQQTFKVKYYLIKAHLKIRTKTEQQQQQQILVDLEQVNFPSSILTNEDNDDQQNEMDHDQQTDTNSSYIMTKMLDWLDKNIVTTI